MIADFGFVICQSLGRDTYHVNLFYQICQLFCPYPRISTTKTASQFSKMIEKYLRMLQNVFTLIDKCNFPLFSFSRINCSLLPELHCLRMFFFPFFLEKGGTATPSPISRTLMIRYITTSRRRLIVCPISHWREFCKVMIQNHVNIHVLQN